MRVGSQVICRASARPSAYAERWLQRNRRRRVLMEAGRGWALYACVPVCRLRSRARI